MSFRRGLIAFVTFNEAAIRRVELNAAMCFAADWGVDLRLIPSKHRPRGEKQQAEENVLVQRCLQLAH